MGSSAPALACNVAGSKLSQPQWNSHTEPGIILPAAVELASLRYRFTYSQWCNQLVKNRLLWFLPIYYWFI